MDAQRGIIRHTEKGGHDLFVHLFGKGLSLIAPSLPLSLNSMA